MSKNILGQSNSSVKQLSLYDDIVRPLERLVRELPDAEKPSARARKHGVTALSTIELLQLLIEAPIPIPALQLLHSYRTPQRMLDASIAELVSIGGITERRAVMLLAALELSRRATNPGSTEPPQVKCPRDAVELLSPLMQGEQEMMRVLCLNTKNRVIGNSLVYQGSVHTTVIRIGELYKSAVRVNATSIIVAHSHPSGDPTPSPEDVAVTKEMNQAGKLIDIDLIDHLVIGHGQQFVSLKERGLFT